MIKKLLLFSFGLASVLVNGQNLTSENFDSFAALSGLGWLSTNQSTPVGASAWAQGGGTAIPPAYNGASTSCALVNFNSTTGAGTISNWLITPVVTMQNGDIVTFYSRAATGGGAFPDRLELRLSTTGASSVTPSGGSAGLGSFTTVLLTINPALTTTGYPEVWTQFTATISGMPSPTACKLAFRYYVTNGGPSGANSNIIGLDAFSVDRPLSAASFFSKNFAIYPNPADNVLNLSSKTNTRMNSVQIVDLNGRVVKNVNVKGLTETEIDVSDINAGMYFVEVASDEGKSTTKFIKK